MMPEIQGLKIQIKGIVQGVGFRPFIFNLAEQNHLTGWVRNTSNSVQIEVNGPSEALQTFVHGIKAFTPPLARIDALEASPCPPGIYTSFEIQTSQPLPGEFMPVSPDVSICADCQRELFDPSNRRYRYPFINCTNCGPRYTIIRDIPYDRPLTTMAGFPLCADCEHEYQNPRDRRFHAQPVACAACGPQLQFVVHGKVLAGQDQALLLTREWIRAGKIIAVKGLGGYHLACDATNPAAVAELRRRKKRSDKPFALMTFDLQSAQQYCIIPPAEEELLLSRQRPIVILERRPDTLSFEEVAPNHTNLGVMLAYTPLHLLLLEPEAGYPNILVMTSANRSEEPIAYQDDYAQNELSELADAFLLHNRPIQTRVDDSVVSTFRGLPYFVRRSRGFAPDPLQLQQNMPSILATGPELKNTFCLTRDRYAFLSHHIGDMENIETLQSFEEGIAHFEHLFSIRPALIACDLHPNYLATRYAEQRSQADQLPLLHVQHHHAHLAACLADNGWTSTEAVIGLCYDGTGYGTDSAIWGSEVLIGGYNSYQRAFHLAYTPLPGGDLAAKKPARMALSHLWQAGLDWDDDLPPVSALCADERTVIKSQLIHQINAPLTSSMGRLFDAASAMMGIRQVATYEGQAAIEMEALVDPHETGYYEFAFQEGQIFSIAMWERLISDVRQAVPIPQMAARFHNGIALLSEWICQQIRRDRGCSVVALSGGVWQNRVLLEKTVARLETNGFKVLIHQNVPTNDGGVALGQALVAAHQ